MSPASTGDSVIHDRLRAVRSRLPELGVDAILINSAVNRRWLSGFCGSAGQLLVSSERALLVTDSRYWERARQEAPLFELWPQGTDRQADFHAAIAALSATRIGLEAQHVTLATLRELEEVPGVSWVPLAPLIEPLRAVKTALELTAVRRAVAIADRAMASVPAWARPGRPERELAWMLEKQMREDGAEAVAFDIIVASGPNGALPHHLAGERALQPGDCLVVDLGARVAGYHSDLTRTFFIGDAPDADFMAVYEVVAEAEAAALRGLRPGMSGEAADALARDIITAAGYGPHFGHSLGHGVGLEIHEEPRLAASKAGGPLQPGMLATVEPGIYLPGWGGVRIEDLVLVTDDGIEVLSQSPYAPAIPL